MKLPMCETSIDVSSFRVIQRKNSMAVSELSRFEGKRRDALAAKCRDMLAAKCQVSIDRTEFRMR